MKEEFEQAIKSLESELPFASNDIEIIKSYVQYLERRNKGLKQSLENKTNQYEHLKGHICK